MRNACIRLALGVGVAMLATGGVAMRDSTAAIQRGFQRDPGEIVMNRSCLACHDLTPIRTQALDNQGWGAVVADMVDNGADVSTEEIPVLTNYLAVRYGLVPEGNGKDIFLETCTVCHERDRIWAHAGADREHWETTLLAMVNEGAFLTDSDFTTLLNYLVRNLGP